MRLLADIKRAFDLLHRERVSSADLVRALIEMDDAPWSELEIDAHLLARMLRPFEVRPRSIRIGGSVVRGYNREDFADPFGRYLPLPASQSPGVV